MNSDYPEKDLDDEVYEDDYYDKHYDQEELIDDDDDKDLIDDDDDGDGKVTKIKESVSYACEECDYRWDDVIVKIKDDIDYDDDPTVICPMCGSMNCTQI